MCRVVEMELSLVYDVMHTKAAIAHSWPGYCIRIMSPPFTAAALLLFCSDSKVGESGWDVMVTYALLLVTLILDVGWLLGTLGSTWTCAFLRHRSHWLVWCSLGRCHRQLRSLGFAAVKDPTSYRLWSGIMGQYNLLSENCRGRRASKLVKKLSAEDAWMEYTYGYSESIALSQCLKDLVFQGVREILEEALVRK
ncbi:hypothetical protein CFC21_027178 [Triticum aestivum]|uniref:DUF4220 domain-containing protein n=2 Tax=Triticum aestivum TaxID=4565 RepID=A0A3B6D7P8_WHEAT|nr:hypothetical protein CFC21_027178 [Triticum aestivum]